MYNQIKWYNMLYMSKDIMGFRVHKYYRGNNIWKILFAILEKIHRNMGGV